ncbi:MAG: FGGY family carbohydrate kinase [Microthrixaceae bacterium]
MALVVGAAFGPSSTDVEVRDADTGELVATAAAHHAEMGPDADDPTSWWRSLASAVSQTDEREIAAISVCGSHPGLVLLDGAGAVLRPMQPWTDPGAALPEPATVVSRLAWLRRTDPSTFERIGAALLPHDWLTYRLCGRIVTDRGGASLTGAWSPRSEGWLPDVLRDLAPGGARGWWQGRLPTVLGPSDRADWLDAPVYELLGLRGRPLVAPGTGDAMAVALALGLGAGRVGVSLGADTTVLAGLDDPIEGTGRVRSRADATGRHLAVATAGGGAALVEAVRDLLGVSDTELGDLALHDDALGTLVLLPELDGRPGGVLTGIASGARRADLARATFEGIACAALDTLELVLAAGGSWDDDEPLRLAAPTPNVEVHAQMLADLSGRPVRAAAGASVAAAGACIQAAAVLQRAAPDVVAAAWDLGDEAWVEPSPGEPTDADRERRRAVHRAERLRLQPSAPPRRSAAIFPSS